MERCNYMTNVTQLGNTRSDYKFSFGIMRNYPPYMDSINTVPATE